METQSRRNKQKKRRYKRKQYGMVKTVVILAGLFVLGRSKIKDNTFVKPAYNSSKEIYWEYRKGSLENDTAVNTMVDDKLLILVNKSNALPEGYQVETKNIERGSCQVSVELYDALHNMLADGEAQGLDFWVASGYRDTAYQQQLLEADIGELMTNEGLIYQQAYDEATRETMPPGYSEHETGLAVDIVARDYQCLDEKQEKTAENQWLQENCSHYGFILRYPKGKEDITGIDYESWHFRYVGVEAAKEIMEQGITLEEYLEQSHLHQHSHS